MRASSGRQPAVVGGVDRLWKSGMVAVNEKAVLFMLMQNDGIYSRPRTPVDRVAARVVQPSRGGKFQESPRTGQQQQQFGERIRELLVHQYVLRPPPDVTDFTGREFGRVTVVTYSHTRWKKNEGNLHYWMVRCACGEHEMRKHTKLNAHARGTAKEDMCERCKKLFQLRRYDEYRRTGKNAPQS